MFSDALAHIKLRADIELKQIDELVKKQIQEDGVQMQELMKKSDKLYADRKKKLKYQQNMLDPKRQIKRVFPILFLSLVFLVLYLVAEKNVWLGAEHNYIILIILMLLSVGCAVTGIIFLKCITWTVIDIKAQLAQDKEKTEVEERVVSTTTTTTIEK